MATSSSPITQVSQTPIQHVGLQPHLISRLLLDLRGQRFIVDRETIMNLPESVLLCLFPNGLVLSRNSAILDGMDGEDDEEVYGVDFDPQCFHYVLEYFKKSGEYFYGTSEQPAGLYQLQQQFIDGQNDPMLAQQNPLLSKQAIIVLREELEYFAIPPPGVSTVPSGNIPGTDKEGNANEELNAIKRDCGVKLLDKRSIFTALQRNVNKENNMAEQHLIDMLCVSGFDRDDVWGFRALEPNRCCISSIALVLLKTGISHDVPSDTNPSGVSVDSNQMATAQKLLLFWRKPARKCWWDGIDVDVGTGDAPKPVKLWARRVWTLELSLI